jgi:hypothetical protein
LYLLLMLALGSREIFSWINELASYNRITFLSWKLLLVVLLSLAIERTLQRWGGGGALVEHSYVYVLHVANYVPWLLLLYVQALHSAHTVCWYILNKKKPLRLQTTIRVKRKVIQIFTPSSKFSWMTLKRSCAPL